MPPQAAPVTSSTTHDVSHAFTPASGTYLGDVHQKSATQTRVLSWVVVLLSAVLGAWAGRILVPKSNGHLIIHSTPLNADISMSNGTLSAPQSPAIFNDLPAGPQDIVVSAAGYRPAEKRVDLKPGDMAIVHIELEHNVPQSTVLTLKTQPENASVLINGMPRGLERVLEFDAAETVHVKVLAPGYEPQEREIHPRPGRSKRTIEFELVPLDTVVNLTTTPRQVTLELNERKWTVTTPYAMQGLSRASKETLTVSSPGYSSNAYR